MRLQLCYYVLGAESALLYELGLVLASGSCTVQTNSSSIRSIQLYLCA